MKSMEDAVRKKIDDMTIEELIDSKAMAEKVVGQLNELLEMTKGDIARMDDRIKELT